MSYSPRDRTDADARAALLAAALAGSVRRIQERWRRDVPEAGDPGEPPALDLPSVIRWSDGLLDRLDRLERDADETPLVRGDQ
jgi:hypothetical protein